MYIDNAVQEEEAELGDRLDVENEARIRNQRGSQDHGSAEQDRKILADKVSMQSKGGLCGKTRSLDFAMLSFRK